MIKSIDKLGRLVIPKELRVMLNLNPGDLLRIEAEGDKLLIEPYRPDCVFCGGTPAAFKFKGKNVCAYCYKEISSSREP